MKRPQGQSKQPFIKLRWEQTSVCIFVHGSMRVNLKWMCQIQRSVQVCTTLHAKSGYTTMMNY